MAKSTWLHILWTLIFQPEILVRWDKICQILPNYCTWMLTKMQSKEEKKILQKVTAGEDSHNSHRRQNCEGCTIKTSLALYGMICQIWHGKVGHRIFLLYFVPGLLFLFGPHFVSFMVWGLGLMWFGMWYSYFVLFLDWPSLYKNDPGKK